MIATIAQDPEQRHKFQTQVEKQLASACDLNADDLIVYCSDPDMQLEPAAALVQLPLDEGTETVPLVDPETREIAQQILQGPKEQIQSLTDGYRALWRLYVFVHPDRADTDTRIRIQSECQKIFGRKSDYKVEPEGPQPEIPGLSG